MFGVMRASCRDPFPTEPLQGYPDTQITFHKHLNDKDLRRQFPRLSYPPHTLLPPLTHSTMRRPPTGRDSINLTAASGFAICEGLLKMAHCLMIELPEAELRDVRYTLGGLLTRADQLLDAAEVDFSLNFDSLHVNEG